MTHEIQKNQEDGIGLVSRRSLIRSIPIILSGSLLRQQPSQASTTKPIGPKSTTKREATIAQFSKIAPKEWGTNVSGVVTRFQTNLPLVALTFDACGGSVKSSGYDSELIAFLTEQKVKATLFLNSRWINSNQAHATTLAGNPLFDIQNHGTKHLPLSTTGAAAYGIKGTTSVGEVYDEVMGNHQLITELTGRAPRFFRSGTAHYDEVAVKIVKSVGERVVGFSINADAGATASKSAITNSLSDPRSGLISIAHMNRPDGSTFEGFETVIRQLKKVGFEFVHLGEVERLLV